DCRNPLHVIANKGLPGLQWPISPGYHIDRNRGLGDFDAQFKPFAMDLAGTPQWVLKAHSSDQIAHLLSYPRPAAALAGLPSPISSNTLSVPTHHRLRPNDLYGVKDARTATIEPNEQSTVDPTQFQFATWRVVLEDVELMPQYQDFGFQPPARL